MHSLVHKVYVIIGGTCRANVRRFPDIVKKEVKGANNLRHAIWTVKNSESLTHSLEDKIVVTSIFELKLVHYFLAKRLDGWI